MTLTRRRALGLMAAVPTIAAYTPLPVSRLLVVDGNSISDSPSPYYHAGNRASWPVWFQRDGHAARCGIAATVNHAVGTWDVRDCAMRAAELIDPLARIAGVESWLILWEGTNALARIVDPLATWQAHADYLEARRAAGFSRVLVGTVISRDPRGLSYSLAQRAEFNALVRERAASVGAEVLDLAAMPGMGGDGDYANAALFHDGIHPTDAGSRQIAAFVADQIAPSIMRGSGQLRGGSRVHLPVIHQSGCNSATASSGE